MRYGKDTDLSVKIVLTEIGYDFEDLVAREMSPHEVVNFAINIAVDYRKWFETRFSEPSYADCVRVVLHTFGLRLDGVPIE